MPVFFVQDSVPYDHPHVFPLHGYRQFRPDDSPDNKRANDRTKRDNITGQGA